MIRYPLHGIHAIAVALWTLILWRWYKPSTSTSPYIRQWVYACMLLAVYYALLSGGYLEPANDHRLSFAVELNLAISNALNLLVVVAGVSLILEGRIRTSATAFWVLSVTMVGQWIVVLADESRRYLDKDPMGVDLPVFVTSLLSLCALVWFYIASLHRLKHASAIVQTLGAAAFIVYGVWQLLFGKLFQLTTGTTKDLIYLGALVLKLLTIWVVFKLSTLPARSNVPQITPRTPA